MYSRGVSLFFLFLSYFKFAYGENVRKSATRTVADTDDCFECNTDYFGHDILQEYNVWSVWKCQNSCVSHTSCLFFSFDPRSGTCYLKYSDEGRISNTSTSLALVSGPRACKESSQGTRQCSECNTDYFGNDLESIVVRDEVRRLSESVGKYGNDGKNGKHRKGRNGDTKHEETKTIAGKKGGQGAGRNGVEKDEKREKRGGEKSKNGKKEDRKLSEKDDQKDGIDETEDILDIPGILSTPSDIRLLAAFDYADTLAENNGVRVPQEHPSSNTSLEYKRCIQACTENDKCTHFTYVWYLSVCYLKQAHDQTIIDQSVKVGQETLGLISGTKSCHNDIIEDITTTSTSTPRPSFIFPLPCFAIGVDFSGNDLWNFGITEFHEDCQRACQSIDACKYFTWARSTKFCYLKKDKTTVISNGQTTIFISGPKFCPTGYSNGQCDNDKYSLVKNYMGEALLDSKQWNFFSAPDPTGGIVDYVDRSRAIQEGYLKVNNSDSVYIGVDHTTKLRGDENRESVRLVSKDLWNDGLWVFSINHMPTGCGTWPAYWLVGNGTWPINGEIDIMEGANKQSKNHIALHTTDGCRLTENDSDKFTGVFCKDEENDRLGLDCYHGATKDNLGCCIDGNEGTFGGALNARGGGIVVAELDVEKHIKVWIFGKNEVPSDLSWKYSNAAIHSHPNPDKWQKKPMAYISLDKENCDGEKYFKNLRIVLNVTFCGGYAGYRFEEPKCPGKGLIDCERFVRENPDEFQETFWDINYLSVYRKHFEIEGQCRTASGDEIDTKEFTFIQNRMNFIYAPYERITRPKDIDTHPLYSTIDYIHQTYPYMQ